MMATAQSPLRVGSITSYEEDRQEAAIECSVYMHASWVVAMLVCTSAYISNYNSLAYVES
jgi:hypothetical protein